MGDCISWCNPVFKRVDTLPDVAVATRNHAYILPDNTIWILNEDGDGYLQMSTKNRDINIDSTDGSLVVAKEAEGNESNFNLKVAPDIINRINILEGKTDKFVREVSVSKQDRQITLTYTYTDDTVKEVSFTDDDTVALLYDDTTLVERIVALEGRLDNNTTYTITDGELVGSDGTRVALPTGNHVTYRGDGTSILNYPQPGENEIILSGYFITEDGTVIPPGGVGSFQLPNTTYKLTERVSDFQSVLKRDMFEGLQLDNDGYSLQSLVGHPSDHQSGLDKAYQTYNTINTLIQFDYSITFEYDGGQTRTFRASARFSTQGKKGVAHFSNKKYHPFGFSEITGYESNYVSSHRLSFNLMVGLHLKSQGNFADPSVAPTQITHIEMRPEHLVKNKASRFTIVRVDNSLPHSVVITPLVLTTEQKVNTTTLELLEDFGG